MIRFHKNIKRILAGICICSVSFVCTAQESLYQNTFPLEDVQLLNGPFQQARDLNIEVLLKYDVDRLLAGYRKEAGLPAKASSYSNWDGLDGHVGGHYLSALAMNYGSTKNAACKKRMEYMLAELKTCLIANGNNHPDWGRGYIGAVPNSAQIWSTLKKGDFKAFRSAWVPLYNIHKMYAGLRDAWLYTGNNDAKELFLLFCDWAIDVTAALTDEQMQTLLDIEHGGMNETFADAYQMTGKEKYLVAARRFSHKAFLDPLSMQKDILDNKHANTQVPKAVGFQRIGELTNDKTYLQAGSFFWQTVTANRTLAFGGNSRREFFPSAATAIDFIDDVEGPESCNSYNMLKLTEELFRTNPLAKYADYYERTLYNHILSTQHPEHGGYVYFTPARPRHYRVYSAPNEGMWCCVGSGMENHGKYAQFIYTHANDALYLNLFVASALNWKEKKITLKQETTFPYEEKTRIIITEGAARFKLMIRYPSWVKEATLKITVNGKAIAVTAKPSSYIAIERQWKKGDIIQVILPMHNSIQQMPNLPNYIAFMHGPILLAAKTGTEDLKGLIAGDSRWGHIAGGRKLPVDKAPVIIEDDQNAISTKLIPVKGKPLTFTSTNLTMNNPLANLTFEPFFKIHDARYMMYWMALSKKEYRTYLDSIAIIEKQKLELQKRTVDLVAPGEQQPEADHFMKQQNSNTGNYLDEFWRDARNEGYFSYQLSTNEETALQLLVRYWGAEKGNRTFDIYIDDEKLVTENISGKWNVQQFRQVEYKIPVAMLKGKKTIRVKFQALQGGTAGAVYDVRLVQTKPFQLQGTSATKKTFSYTNPITRDTAISMRDHFIIKVDKKWYSVGTSEPVWTGPNPGVRLLVSDDLINWKQHSFLIDAKKLPPDCPYNGRFWAPEIHFIKNKYYLTVNSGRVTADDPKGMKTHSVWLFSSDNVTGPYQLVNNAPLTAQYNNDATLFEDEDGQTYMYCSGGGLFQAKIDLKTGKLTTPVEKFLDKKQPGWPEWMVGGIEGPFVIKKEGTYFMFFSTWTRGYEVGLLKSKNPLGPWELVSPEPIFGTRKKGYRPELASGGGYAHLQFQDTEDPYQETGHNALFIGPDGNLWSSCHYFMYEKRPYPYSQTFEPWELTPQMGYEPVYFKDGRFYIKGPTWTTQKIEY